MWIRRLKKIIRLWNENVAWQIFVVICLGMTILKPCKLHRITLLITCFIIFLKLGCVFQSKRKIDNNAKNIEITLIEKKISSYIKHAIYINSWNTTIFGCNFNPITVNNSRYKCHHLRNMNLNERKCFYEPDLSLISS